MGREFFDAEAGEVFLDGGFEGLFVGLGDHGNSFGPGGFRIDCGVLGRHNDFCGAHSSKCTPQTELILPHLDPPSISEICR
jgi:hypothetical protein